MIDDRPEPVRLDPAVVADDDELLADAVMAWVGVDDDRDDEEIGRFESALEASLDAARWALANRLLGLLRAAADARVIRAVVWAFNEGRRHPLPPAPEGGRS